MACGFYIGEFHSRRQVSGDGDPPGSSRIPLALPLDLSLSWGPYCAILYAAAKRGFKKIREMTRASIRERPLLEERDALFLGYEMAYKTEEGGKTHFIIGDKPESVGDFEKQIETRFRGRFDDSWEEALRLVRGFDEEVLLSQGGFYERVNKPNRDTLAKKWTELSRGLKTSFDTYTRL